MNQSTKSNADIQPDIAQALYLARISRLPEIYENILLKPGDKTDQDRKKEATDALLLNAPSNIARDGIFVLQRDNITTIVIHDPKTNTATITFDPTYNGGNLMNNPDMQDNFNVKPTHHTLGGLVHNGLYEKLVTEGMRERPLVERLEAIIYDLASKD